jgi:hypothetical protein
MFTETDEEVIGQMQGVLNHAQHSHDARMVARQHNSEDIVAITESIILIGKMCVQSRDCYNTEANTDNPDQAYKAVMDQLYTSGWTLIDDLNDEMRPATV